MKALLLYALAYWLFLTVLRFLDAFQHTYEVYASHSLEAAAADPRRDLRYEYENTYSNLAQRALAWLNVLVLNFPYHNAHHVRPSVPWYRLPALHRSLYGKQDRQVITCRNLAASFHRHRVARVLADDYGAVAANGNRAPGISGRHRRVVFDRGLSHAAALRDRAHGHRHAARFPRSPRLYRSERRGCRAFCDRDSRGARLLGAGARCQASRDSHARRASPGSVGSTGIQAPPRRRLRCRHRQHWAASGACWSAANGATTSSRKRRRFPARGDRQAGFRRILCDGFGIDTARARVSPGSRSPA